MVNPTPEPEPTYIGVLIHGACSLVFGLGALVNLYMASVSYNEKLIVFAVATGCTSIASISQGCQCAIAVKSL